MCVWFTDYKTVFQSICSYSRGLSLIHRTPFREEETKAQGGKEVLGAEQALGPEPPCYAAWGSDNSHKLLTWKDHVNPKMSPGPRAQSVIGASLSVGQSCVWYF